VCVAFGAEYTDHSIRDLNDVPSLLKIPVLATVPTVLTEVEIIKKRRLNMSLFVAGGFYIIFMILLIIRELVIAYVPSLLDLQAYKDILYKLMDLVGVV
jgi:hypothetical protein